MYRAYAIVTKSVYMTKMLMKSYKPLLINPLECFFDSEGHVALDRYLGPGYNTLLLRIIPGYLFSACPHRQFHTLPGLLDSRVALSNSYTLTHCVPWEAVCPICIMVFGMTRPGGELMTYRVRGGHAIRLPLSQPDTVVEYYTMGHYM